MQISAIQSRPLGAPVSTAKQPTRRVGVQAQSGKGNVFSQFFSQAKSRVQEDSAQVLERAKELEGQAKAKINEVDQSTREAVKSTDEKARSGAESVAKTVNERVSEGVNKCKEDGKSSREELQRRVAELRDAAKPLVEEIRSQVQADVKEARESKLNAARGLISYAKEGLELISKRIDELENKQSEQGKKAPESSPAKKTEEITITDSRSNS